MKLNRWTILAIILILSAVIGLPFRPLGPEGLSGVQTIHSQGLSLTCPESLTAVPDETYEIECVIVNDSPFQGYVFGTLRQGRLPPAYSNRSLNQGSDGTFLLANDFTRNRPIKIYARAFVSQNDVVLAPTDILVESRAVINLTIKQYYSFYIGRGLLMLQAIALAIGFMLYALILLRGGIVSRSSAGVAFLMVDMLYLTYLVQLLLYPIYGIETRLTQHEFDRDFSSFMLIYLNFAWLVVFARWRFFLRMMPREWTRSDTTPSANRGATVRLPVVPFLVVFAIGCVSVLMLATLFYSWSLP